LEKSGYLEPAIADKTVFGDDLAKRLRTFQKLNGLTVNGKLDNSTLNRLMNFNFESNSIERAVPYDASKLPAGFDNSKDIAA
jgi:murein L,D-transpeptidase YcbB/YkuD